jgi:hypothetical protein
MHIAVTPFGAGHRKMRHPAKPSSMGDRMGSRVTCVDGFDLPAGMPWRFRPEVLLERSLSSGPLGVMVKGHEVFGLDPVEMLVEVAAHVQDDYIDEFFQVWPLCSLHRTGCAPR